MEVESNSSQIRLRRVLDNFIFRIYNIRIRSTSGDDSIDCTYMANRSTNM